MGHLVEAIGSGLFASGSKRVDKVNCNLLSVHLRPRAWLVVGDRFDWSDPSPFSGLVPRDTPYRVGGRGYPECGIRERAVSL